MAGPALPLCDLGSGLVYHMNCEALLPVPRQPYPWSNRPSFAALAVGLGTQDFCSATHRLQQQELEDASMMAQPAPRLDGASHDGADRNACAAGGSGRIHDEDACSEVCAAGGSGRIHEGACAASLLCVEPSTLGRNHTA